jgi:pimeloyl-ACP methyl ester carboxylesterase
MNLFTVMIAASLAVVVCAEAHSGGIDKHQNPISKLQGSSKWGDSKQEAARTECTPYHSNRDYVVLLHGYARTALSMKRLEWSLKHHGYRVINVSYPSRRVSGEQLGDSWLPELLKNRASDPDAKIHFVTHSLGGLIVRRYLATNRLENVGRVVMLGPPNHGSEVIDRLRSGRVTRLFLGKNEVRLGTGAADFPQKLGRAEFEVGVIAGDRPINPFLAHLLPGPSDGKVTVASARLDGMRDFATVHSSHTWMMWRGETVRLTLAFLQTGRFAAAD